MSDEHQTLFAQNTSIEAMAVSNVTAHPENASPLSLEGPQKSSLEPAPAPLMETDPDGFARLEPSPAWTGEVTAPNENDALSYLALRGRFRAGLVAGAIIAATALGWGFVSSLHVLKSKPASTGLQQTTRSERAAPTVDQETASKGPSARQVYTPAVGDVGRNRSELIRRADQSGVAPMHNVPSIEQTAATKPAATPLQRGGKTRHRPTPAPETRPNTIEGWKVRDIFGGTAVLQGPDGIRKVSIGDTVPGAGRIDSIVRWGSRWVVATSKGLITTD
jgi:hypothetical protein